MRKKKFKHCDDKFIILGEKVEILRGKEARMRRTSVQVSQTGEILHLFAHWYHIIISIGTLKRILRVYSEERTTRIWRKSFVFGGFPRTCLLCSTPHKNPVKLWLFSPSNLRLFCHEFMSLFWTSNKQNWCMTHICKLHAWFDHYKCHFFFFKCAKSCSFLQHSVPSARRPEAALRAPTWPPTWPSLFNPQGGSGSPALNPIKCPMRSWHGENEESSCSQETFGLGISQRPEGPSAGLDLV